MLSKILVRLRCLRELSIDEFVFSGQSLYILSELGALLSFTLSKLTLVLKRLSRMLEFRSKCLNLLLSFK
jgi:hypothetical protein